MIESPSKFLSPRHIAYSESVNLEILHSQEAYRIRNITKMQLSNLQLALQFYCQDCLSKDAHSEIFTLDKTNHIILQKMKEMLAKESKAEDFYNLSIRTSSKDILDLSATMAKIALLISDKDKNERDIKEIVESLKQSLNAYKNDNDTIFSDIKDYDFSNTKQTLIEAKKALDEIFASLDKYTAESKKDFENRFNKDIINLTASIIGTTHLPALTHILIHKLGVSTAKKLITAIVLGGVALGPFGISISIIWLLVDIYEFIFNKAQQNKKLKAAYEAYGAITSIYQHLDYPLANLLNFRHIGAGNLITTQSDNLFSYYLYPNDLRLDSGFLYTLFKNKVFEDVVFRATLSLRTAKHPNQAYAASIFEKNNKTSTPTYIDTKKRTQFSTFSFEHLYKIYANDKGNNFTHSSAFQHLQNVFLKFDDLLFVKSATFSSILASDMLMQSFMSSRQSDKPRDDKVAIFLTNCLHNGTPESFIQEHIKTRFYNNESTKDNILFLSAMYRVEKSVFVERLISHCINLYKQIDDSNGVESTLNKLFETYKVKRDDDKALCDMTEQEFCNFIYDLCQIFIPADYIENNKAESLLSKELETLIATILDVSKILSHFGSYEIAKLKKYQKDIQNEYERQKKAVESFFEKEHFKSNNGKKIYNIFYKANEVKNLCLALLKKYFNVTDNEYNLESLLAQGKEGKDSVVYSNVEILLASLNKIAYHKLTIEYVAPLLPLNKLFLNCIEENDAFLFCRIIIDKLNAEQNDNIHNFIAHYIQTIGLYALLHTDEIKEIVDKNAEKIIKSFYDITTKTSEAILVDTGDKILDGIITNYKLIQAIVFKYDENQLKEVAKSISSSIASALDKPYTKDLPSLPKKFALLSSVANAAISHISQAILDIAFPTQIASVNDMKQLAITLLFALNRHHNTPYATCKGKYLTFPVEITQTLINADVKAVIIGGSALDSGLFMHTPSVALFNEDSQNALMTLKETLRGFMNDKVNLDKLEEIGGITIKEAYAKLWYYLDMGENKEIEHYLRHNIKVKPSYYKLENLTSDKYISTKLKKANRLSKDDEIFIEVEGNAKGGVKFNRDFAIQLKRVAEYNYRVYTGAIHIEENTKNQKRAKRPQNADFSKADKSNDEYLCGNLIYDEDYIPTTIDIIDKKQ